MEPTDLQVVEIHIGLKEVEIHMGLKVQEIHTDPRVGWIHTRAGLQTLMELRGGLSPMDLKEEEWGSTLRRNREPKVTLMEQCL